MKISAVKERNRVLQSPWFRKDSLRKWWGETGGVNRHSLRRVPLYMGMGLPSCYGRKSSEHKEQHVRRSRSGRNHGLSEKLKSSQDGCWERKFDSGADRDGGVARSQSCSFFLCHLHVCPLTKIQYISSPCVIFFQTLFVPIISLIRSVWNSHPSATPARVRGHKAAGLFGYEAYISVTLWQQRRTIDITADTSPQHCPP